MANLEDKILGEKLQYYCSSSEEEDNDSRENVSGDKLISSIENIDGWKGTASNVSMNLKILIFMINSSDLHT